MNSLRLGIVGLGMGGSHADKLLAGKVERCELRAVCDSDPAKLAKYPSVKGFSDAASLFASGDVDAVLIATPHYSHTTLGIAALQAGLHVLIEKPLSVHKADCERLLAAHTRKDQVFAAMFNQRTDLYYMRLREMIRSGELGEVYRVNWIITDWFRSYNYYASGGWRATWAGEGGGVLLNQCPHNLDLFQWIFGMPKTVRAFCRLGRYHPIEVEDDVTAYMELPNGASAVFIASTGEAPGTNRLEVSADRGRVVVEGNRIQFHRTEVSVEEFSRTTDQKFTAPPIKLEEFTFEKRGGQHAAIMQNFTDAILDGAPLLSPASDGIHSVELGNAMLYSSFTGKTVNLPLDSATFENKLKELIATSRYVKPPVREASKATM